MTQPLSYRLPPLHHQRLRFTLRSEGPARLPESKGSMLRGCFGHALRRAVCAQRQRIECIDCPLRGACVYTRVFETFLDGPAPPFLSGQRTAPRPYVFEVEDPRCDFAADDELRFDLLLFGSAIELQAFAVLAVEQMARVGLSVRKHPFRLVSVEALGADRKLHDLAYRPDAPWRIKASPLLPVDNGLPSDCLTLRFTTPTRIVVDREPATRVSPRLLTFKMLQRVLHLAHFFGPSTEVPWTFRPLLLASDAVSAVRQDLRWVETWRYSNRQRGRMKLGGFVGEVTLEGDLTPLHPLLRAVEIAHLGKGTTFGMGKVELVDA